jgi:hypothetical protein
LAPPVNNTPSNDVSVPVGDNEICEFVGTNLSENMDSEVVEMASSRAGVAAPNEAEKSTEFSDVVNLNNELVRSIFTYLHKK